MWQSICNTSNYLPCLLPGIASVHSLRIFLLHFEHLEGDGTRIELT